MPPLVRMSREPLSCADEAEAFGDHAHSHSHSHGHSHGHGHGHDHEDPDGFSLLQFIDVHRAWCLKCGLPAREGRVVGAPGPGWAWIAHPRPVVPRSALDTRPLPGLFRPYAQRLEHVPVRGGGKALLAISISDTDPAYRSCGARRTTQS